MNNDTALVLLLADRQRDIEELRAEVRRLTDDNEALRAHIVATDAPD